MLLEQENEQLIQHVKILGYLKSKKLEEALRKIPRHLFVPENIIHLAYRDIPLSIGHYQTISQPSTVIAMTEAMDVKPNQKILEIGAGSGWQAAILSYLVNPKGFIYTIERIHELVEFSRNNLKKLKIKNVEVIEGDGSLGYEKEKFYDRIIVTCACPDIPPPLLEQLKVNGKLVIPVGNAYLQDMLVITKRKNRIERKSIGSFMFVPLLGQYGFK